MESRERIQQEIESLSEVECSEVLHFILQLKGQFSEQEVKCAISAQQVWIDQLEEDDDEEWVDL